MTASLNRIRLILLATVAALAVGCAPTPTEEPVDPAEIETMADSARVMAETGDHEAAAGLYEDIAARVAASERPEWLFRAAEARIEANQSARARQLLDELDPADLEVAQRYRVAMLLSRADLAENRPRQAYLRLDVADDTVPGELLPELLGIRGEALFRMEDPERGIVQLTRRVDLLEGEERLAALEDIWDRLIGAPSLPEPDTARQDPTTAGWLALAHAGRDSWQEPEGFEAAVEDWAMAHPQHPATEMTEHLLELHQERFRYPEQITLLLPLSGSFADLGEAVRDGFLAAHFAQPPERRPRIRVRDTGEDPDQAREAYRQAVSEGAGMVVGPLTREAVAALARLDERPVPILALNYLLDEDYHPADMVQFGLQPEEEARQVARRMIREGLEHTIALTPETDWGRRMLDSFRDEMESLGGEVVDHGAYLPQRQDHSNTLTRVLGLDRSMGRHSALQNLLDEELVFEPRRRQDVAGIFLAAQEDQASLIRPQLRFHHAMDLPVFATSHVYRPGRTSDSDLDGIRFADMPWSLEAEGEARETRERVAELWPELFDQHGRLFALGFDAYRLVPILRNFENPLEPPLAAMTGVLSLDNGRVRRDLGWAVFSGGEPVPMEPLDEIALPTPLLLEGP